MSAKAKKKNPNRIPLTQADMKKAEARWQQELEDMHTKASQKAAIWYQAITYLALCNVFSFTTEDLQTLQAEMNRISEKIIATEGKHKNYTIQTVRRELLKYNVEFDMDEIEEIENG